MTVLAQRRTWLVAAVALVPCLLRAAPALAGNPGVAECLTASNDSLHAGNEHERRAERAALLVCANRSCPEEIRQECSRRIAEVDALLPTVVFSARDAAGNTLTAVKVTMDGELLAENLDGTALPVDPGTHTFTFESASQAPVIQRLVIRESEKARRETVRFGSKNEPESTVVAIPPPEPSPPNSGLPTQKVIAIVAAAVGVVGIGAGSAFGLSAMAKKEDAQERCPTQCSDDAGVEAWKDAKSAGQLSTGLFVLGGVGLAGGAALWFLTPSAQRPLQVGVGCGTLRLAGSF